MTQWIIVRDGPYRYLASPVAVDAYSTKQSKAIRFADRRAARKALDWNVATQSSWPCRLVRLVTREAPAPKARASDLSTYELIDALNERMRQRSGRMSAIQIIASDRDEWKKRAEEWRVRAEAIRTCTRPTDPQPDPQPTSDAAAAEEWPAHVLHKWSPELHNVTVRAFGVDTHIAAAYVYFELETGQHVSRECFMVLGSDDDPEKPAEEGHISKDTKSRIRMRAEELWGGGPYTLTSWPGKHLGAEGWFVKIEDTDWLDHGATAEAAAQKLHCHLLWASPTSCMDTPRRGS